MSARRAAAEIEISDAASGNGVRFIGVAGRVLVRVLAVMGMRMGVLATICMPVTVGVCIICPTSVSMLMLYCVLMGVFMHRAISMHMAMRVRLAFNAGFSRATTANRAHIPSPGYDSISISLTRISVPSVGCT